ncbi:MAG: TauD/TfdA family dioxygenase [Cyanobacteria bacterium J06649_4]
MTTLTNQQINLSNQSTSSSSQPLIYMADTISQAVNATTHGYPVVVVNLTPTEAALLQLCKQLAPHYNDAPFSEIDIIQAKPQANNTQNPVRQSLEAHPAHTDGNFEENPPQKFLLQFAETDAGGGGLSHFWPIAPMLALMPKHYKDALFEYPVRFRHLNKDGSYTEHTSQVFFYRPNGQWAMRYAADRQVHLEPVSGDTVLVNQALSWINNYIQRNPPAVYKAQKGDIVIIDNDVLMHGRSAMSAEYGNKRLIRRVYLECPTFFTGL